MNESNPIQFLGIPNSIPTILITIFDILIMFMPTIGYLDTVRIMVNSKSSAAFSYDTCLILLTSHGLKVIYFIYHPYAVRIFGQSVTQIGAALLMAFVKFHYSEKNCKLRRRSNFSYFLYIRNTVNFLEFLISIALYICLTLLTLFVCFHIFEEKLIIDLIGILANLIESTVSVPTFIKIVIKRDISNLSAILIAQFVLGDILKLALFLLNNAPLSFIGGALLQTSLDLTLLAFYLKLSFCHKENRSDKEVLLLNKQEEFAMDSLKPIAPQFSYNQDV